MKVVQNEDSLNSIGDLCTSDWEDWEDEMMDEDEFDEEFEE